MPDETLQQMVDDDPRLSNYHVDSDGWHCIRIDLGHWLPWPDLTQCVCEETVADAIESIGRIEPYLPE